MGSEAQLQTKIRNHLKLNGWMVNKFQLGSSNGWPDLIAIKYGIALFIEVKQKGKKAQALQLYVHEQLRLHGAHVILTDDYKSFQRQLITAVKQNMNYLT